MDLGLEIFETKYSVLLGIFLIYLGEGGVWAEPILNLYLHLEKICQNIQGFMRSMNPQPRKHESI